MLTSFATELNSTQSELEALLAKVEALKGQIKNLKTAENKVLKVMENLKNLVSELPEVAIAELKKEILSVFPSDLEPTKEPEFTTAEVFNNFVTEVPKIESVEPIATEQPSISKIEVSELCFYFEKPNQGIEAYFAVANKNIGKEWADYLTLMGCVAEVRKAEVFDNSVRWEIKATKISHNLILQINKVRSSLYSSVPVGNAEYTKKSTTGNVETKENLEDLKMLAPPSNTQRESLGTTRERNLVAS